VRAIGHALALALACILLLGLVADARAATVPADFYGVNSGRALMNDPASRPAAFATMRAGGLSYVRIDASWSGVEPSAPIAGVHTYDWAKTDAFVADLARNGLRWYPMLGYSTPWAAAAGANPFSPPASDADFMLFAAALAGRYGSAGTFWAAHPELSPLPTTVYGIWNEPSNAEFWQGAEATPARYMRLYLTARLAIKAADPAARVATAGLLDSGVVDANAYLRAMLDSVPAARGQIDIVGWHPYVGDLGQIFASIKRARTTLNTYGLANVPIEVSEVGWHSGYPAAQRAAWARGLAATLPHAGLNVTRLLPYVWSGDSEWQLTNPDGSPGPVSQAYLAGIHDAVVAQQPAAAVAPANTSAAGTTKPAAKSCKPAKAGKRGKAKAAKKCSSKAKKAKRTGKAKAKAKAARARAAAKARAAGRARSRNG